MATKKLNASENSRAYRFRHRHRRLLERLPGSQDRVPAVQPGEPAEIDAEPGQQTRQNKEDPLEAAPPHGFQDPAFHPHGQNKCQEVADNAKAALITISYKGCPGPPSHSVGSERIQVFSTM
jgi:hypothetical protein